MLFEDLIPRTWVALFHTLLDSKFLDNIFEAWPRPQGTTQHGDGINWRHLPEKLLLYTASISSPCWPVLAPDQKVTNYGDLSSVFVASPGEDVDVLRALTTFGLDITQPSVHVFKLFGTCDNLDFTSLTPEEVHSTLVVSCCPILLLFVHAFCIIGRYSEGETTFQISRGFSNSQISTVHKKPRQHHQLAAYPPRQWSLYGPQQRI